jgi:hypothetical protein
MIAVLTIPKQAALRILASLSFVFWFSTFALAQSRLSGSVVEHKKAIPNANVFLNNATIGTRTDNVGNFTLQGVKPGQYELVISFVGFETYHQVIVLGDEPRNLGQIELTPQSVALKEVRIQDMTDPVWQRNYQWFKDSFLGTTSLARNCKILNPAILDFAYYKKQDSLTASSADFLVVDNYALGYRIKYLIDHFVRCDSGRTVAYKGSVLFENMKATPPQQRHWQKTRREVYEGSVTHFLRSAVANRLEDEGFRVFQYAVYANPQRFPDSLIAAKIRQFTKKTGAEKSRYQDSLSFWKRQSKSPKMLHSLLNFPLNLNEFVHLTNQKKLYALGCENDGLYVIHHKAHHFPKSGNIDFLSSPYNQNSSLLNFNSPFAIFDSSGWIIEPNSISITGAWGRNKVAGLLPVDYDPQ